MKIYVIFLRDWNKIQSGIYAGKTFYLYEEVEQFLIHDTDLSREELFPDASNVNGDEFIRVEDLIPKNPLARGRFCGGHMGASSLGIKPEYKYLMRTTIPRCSAAGLVD
ncbi:MAG: hypothetical protein LBU18_07940 [Treponema sp.]|jgi:hypothetical protein|nr:hypothetical protein [Treponema sp.]